MDNFSETLSVDETAKILNIGNERVTILCRTGKLRGINPSGRKWLVFKSSLEAYMSGKPEIIENKKEEGVTMENQVKLTAEQQAVKDNNDRVKAVNDSYKAAKKSVNEVLSLDAEKAELEARINKAKDTSKTIELQARENMLNAREATIKQNEITWQGVMTKLGTKEAELVAKENQLRERESNLDFRDLKTQENALLYAMIATSKNAVVFDDLADDCQACFNDAIAYLKKNKIPTTAENLENALLCKAEPDAEMDDDCQKCYEAIVRHLNIPSDNQDDSEEENALA